MDLKFFVGQAVQLLHEIITFIKPGQDRQRSSQPLNPKNAVKQKQTNFPLPKHFSSYHLPPHKQTVSKNTHHLPPHPFISPLLIAPCSSVKLKVDVISCTQSAVKDSSISDIFCRSVCLSEPTNNQSLQSIKTLDTSKQ